MARSPSRSPSPPARARGKPPSRPLRAKSAPARRAYHHGNLRAALVEAALALVEDVGADRVTVREAARRAGVSSGAPFRHFPDRTALLTAVAEEAMSRLRVAVEQARARTAGRTPLERLRALGAAYLRWARDNPTLLQIISARRLIDFAGSARLMADNEALRAWMRELIGAGQADGTLRAGDTEMMLLALRALGYGLARMHVDGHMAQWDVPGTRTPQAMEAVMDLFLEGLSRKG